TIGLVITTDGTISDIPREDYVQPESRVISELKQINKPFIILLNSLMPKSEKTINLAKEMEEQYGTKVMPVSCADLSADDIKEILSAVLSEFPIKEIAINIPKWIVSLNTDHWLKSDIFKFIYAWAKNLTHISDVRNNIVQITQSQFIDNVNAQNIDYGTGGVLINVGVNNDLFYKILGEKTKLNIENEADLMQCIIEMAAIKEKYFKIQSAIEEVEATGYGIVMPSIDELSLEEPEIVKQSGKYGVKLNASAPSIHMMKANITTEVSPIVGSERQSEELVNYLMQEFEENPKKIWESNIFGKSLHELVNEGLHNKLYKMPPDARLKLQETIERIINEGCSGLVCIIL
ncbi:MAG: stage IV sporulation protein A, partial [Oscillospiraceae bacterium]